MILDSTAFHVHKIPYNRESIDIVSLTVTQCMLSSVMFAFTLQNFL